jgi:hypothetical protein
MEKPKMSYNSKINKKEIDLILIGFDYDKPTQETITWFQGVNLPISNPKFNIHRINDLKAVSGKLKNLLLNENYSLEIFLGHGVEDGLLGADKNSGLKHSIIYGIKVISSIPGALFAFCCHSARRFGRVYSSFQDKSFMGFRGELPIPEEVYQLVKIVFQKTANDIITSESITKEHEDNFKRIIDDIIKKAHSGQIQCENSFLIELWLNQYKVQLLRL